MKNSIHPKPLRKGDSVAIASTARKVSYQEMKPAIDVFSSWGLKVILPDGLFDSENQFAGSDHHRAEIFNSLLRDSQIRTIICARGGYGTVRMLDSVDFEVLKSDPKWIVGYSDVTAIHSHISQNIGMETIHGIMPINIPEDALEVSYPAIESLRSVLFGEKLEYQFPLGKFYREGSCMGEIVGGNLSILYSLTGSVSDVDTAGKILFIEDLDEYLYHIDRMMQNLKRSGKLSAIKGLIVGSMTDMHDNSIPFGMKAEEIVWQYVKDYDFPVYMDCENRHFGHVGTQNLALPLGREVLMKVENGEFSLTF